jgi:hypothetical protein
MNVFPERVVQQDNNTASLEGGITLRDYFAAAAMQAILSPDGTHPNFWELARWSYKIADAMLETRKE